MKIKTQNMTEGRLGTQILRFSIPLMISNVIQVMFHMADIAVVGRFAGSAALGAVGSTATLVTLFTGFLMGFGNGVNVLAARSFGARRDEDLRQNVHTSALICLLFGLLLLAGGLLFGRDLLEILNTKAELIDGADLYLRIYFWGMPAVALYNFGSGVLSAVGDTKRPLYILLFAGLLNVLLNLAFVIGLHMDVAGVAYASVISQYLSAILIVLALFRGSEAYHLRWSAMRITPRKAAVLLKLGLPCGLQYAIFAIANLFIQVGVNRFDAITVAGNSAAANADGLVYDVMVAFCTACSSFVGQNFGAGKRDRILKSYYISMAYSFGAGAILGIGLVIFGRQFLGLFTTETAVIDAGMTRLTVMGFSYAVSAFMDVTIAASRGLGKSVIPTAFVIGGCCVFRIIWVYTVFAWMPTMTVLYAVYILTWIVTSTAEILYFARCYRKARFV